ncbi:hypothetical protein ANCDUO_03272 [Ancylostoma duodenale]|uniref:Uncharacterized protein n=1 Tax=Ancylostoma duodenale TaxID=51022 RepID=A0A0C2DUC9_9BILA|nr:hypothetical protein ANCDUO_03272 [Ancylostoma duodenale]
MESADFVVQSKTVIETANLLVTNNVCNIANSDLQVMEFNTTLPSPNPTHLGSTSCQLRSLQHDYEELLHAVLQIRTPNSLWTRLREPWKRFTGRCAPFFT